MSKTPNFPLGANHDGATNWSKLLTLKNWIAEIISELCPV